MDVVDDALVLVDKDTVKTDDNEEEEEERAKRLSVFFFLYFSLIVLGNKLQDWNGDLGVLMENLGVLLKVMMVGERESATSMAHTKNPNSQNPREKNKSLSPN